ncbi:caspase family protein [Microvirga sp. CF3062]|uniref:caspase family protein n=1 Tax=Microvirga sp. CF3062 TaxID=3110182 RepID=UPI002E77BFB9|nr:caspase family protein [Microvirga sp. CF3062]MEE1654937.1 caspase family protein [Microvirga sp. CF3062]
MFSLKRAIVFTAFALTAVLGQASSALAQDRLALVVGQGAYEGRTLATAANDAGLIAQTLTSAGFEVVQGRDLNANDLRSLVRDFLDKVENLEPGSTVMVYLAGHGVQLEGDNYLLPVDARIQRDADIAIEGFRLSDLVRSLEQSPVRVKVVVADMAREFSLSSTGEPIARGLALIEPPSGFLMAFSSAPNIVATDGPGPYGTYATALAEMIRQPGLSLDEVFARTRLRTHETTNGLQIPWHAANLGNASFVFFEPAETAAAPLVREVRRIEEVPAEEAYAIAVERDTIQDYQTFLRRHPDHRLSRRVKALVAARREAVVWRRTVARNTREAYWTYLRAYPRGPHAADCRRRLTRLSASYSPPAVFEEVIYDDLPPLLPEMERIEVVEVVTIIREVPVPRLPAYLLPRWDEDDEDFITIIREPPPPPIMAGILPIPISMPVPYWARPPRSFYQPIAPRTPRGPVAIPVRAPYVFDRADERPPGPRRNLRDEQPRVPRQPGLAAPLEPIPVSVNPRGPREGRDVRPGERPRMRPDRLPSRRIPLIGEDQERPRSIRPETAEPGERPDRPRGQRPDRRERDQDEIQPEAPVRGAARPRDPRLDADEILPRQPRPDRPRIEIERPDRDRAGREPERRDPRNQQDRRPDPERAERAPVIGLPQIEDRRPRRDDDEGPRRRIDRPAFIERSDRDERPARPQRPALREELRPDRPSRDVAPREIDRGERRARPIFEERPASRRVERPDMPAFQARPMPRMEAPARAERAMREPPRAFDQPRPGRDMERPSRDRPSFDGPPRRQVDDGRARRCQPGRPCPQER